MTNVHDHVLALPTTVPSPKLLVSEGRRVMVIERGKVLVAELDAGVLSAPRTLAIDDNAGAVAARGSTLAWVPQASSTVRAIDLDSGAITPEPKGWEAFGGRPVFLGEAAGTLARLQSPGMIATPSTDLAWVAIFGHRRETDVIFAAGATEEAKALAKNVTVKAITRSHVVAIAVKKSVWQLLTVESWKKAHEGPLPGPGREVAVSPGGRWIAIASGFAPSTITVLDARDGRVVHEQPFEGAADMLAWVGPNGIAYRLSKLAQVERLGWLELELDGEDSVA